MDKAGSIGFGTNLDEKSIDTLICQGVDLYRAYFPLFKRNQKRTQVAALLENGFPRVVFEAGFIEGDAQNVHEALSLDRMIIPEEVSVFYLVTQEEDRVKCDCIEYQKPEDYVAWQQWRLEGIISGAYQTPHFPPYIASYVHRVAPDGRSAQVFLNRNTPSEEFNFKVTLPSGPVERMSRVTERTPQPSSYGFRFKVALIFREPLTPQEAERLILME